MKGSWIDKVHTSTLSSNCTVGRHLFHFIFTLLLYRDKSHSGCVECAIMMLRTQGDEGMIVMPSIDLCLRSAVLLNSDVNQPPFLTPFSEWTSSNERLLVIFDHNLPWILLRAAQFI